MIDVICTYPNGIIMGVASLVGAMSYAAFSIYSKKRKDPGVEINFSQIVDTAWQSVIAGVAAGSAIGCGLTGILTAMVTGIGIDKIANKLKIGDQQVLNLVQMISKFVTKK